MINRTLARTLAARTLAAGTLAAGALALLPGMAVAHTGGGHTHGFAVGFLHPISGPDHILAMVLVGMLAWQLGQRAMWRVPMTFVAVMTAGGALGVAGIDLPLIEVGIALSVVVFGAVIALGLRAPLAVAMGLAGLFAIFHGHAHGTEMPDGATSLGYAAGFMIATTLLHLGGLGIGYAIALASRHQAKADHWPVLMRMAGGAASVAGLVLLAGAA